MKTNFIAGFLSGAVIFGAVGVLAAGLVANPNPFPVQLNGNDVDIEGYNIEGSTYFKLRDIADVVGGFGVDFNNDTIQLSKDGYVYDNTVKEIIVDEPMKTYFSEYGIRIPEFSEADIGTQEFINNFIFYYYTGIGDPTSSSYENGYFSWSEQTIKDQYKLLFGEDMPDYYPTDGIVKYDSGVYKIAVSNYGDVQYVFNRTVNDDNDIYLIYTITDSTNTNWGEVIFHIAPANNDNGYIIKSKITS